MKHLLHLLPAGLLLAGCITTGTNLQDMDLDGNGAISRGEFTDAVAGASFRATDRNGDGFVDLAEWRTAERGDDSLFRLRDMSRNGRISPQEARLAAEKNGSLSAFFASVDTNRDGQIDRTEARRYQSSRR